MKRSLLLIFFLPFVVHAQQKFSDPDLQSLVDAEWAFINMAKAQNTRDAFITFLADSAVTFGENPRKGIMHLQKQKPDKTWLYWEPVYSDIAASGDFGFNTGPWEFRESRDAKEAVAFGRFTTVWKKIDGQWKALIDMGISHPKPETKDSLRTSSIQLKNVQAVSKSIMQKVIAEEQKFIKDFASKKNKAYPTYLSADAKVYRHQSLPLSAKELTTSAPLTAIAYQFLDGDIASSGDLAYVYGKALLDVKDSKGVVKKVNGNYMRIWKKEDGKSWKVVLDVLTYL